MITLTEGRPRKPRRRRFLIGRITGRLSQLFAGKVAEAEPLPGRIPKHGRWVIGPLAVDVRITAARRTGHTLEYRIEPVAGSGHTWIRADLIEEVRKVIRA